MSLTITPSEREAFLAEARNAILSIGEDDGGAVASPVWFLYEPGGHITLHLNDPSIKVSALDRTGRATLTVQDEGDVRGTGRPLRYVSVTGSVVENRPFDLATDGQEAWESICRYLGEEAGQRYVGHGGEAYMVGDGAPLSARVVRIRPERWFTRDYGKAGERWDEVVGKPGAAAR